MPDDPPAPQPDPTPPAPAPVLSVPDDWKVHVTQLREENKQRRLREKEATEALAATEQRFGAIVKGMGLDADADEATIAKAFADFQEDRTEAQKIKREQAFTKRVKPLISEAKYDEKLAMRLLGRLAYDTDLSDDDLKSHVEQLGKDFPAITANARSGQNVRPGGGPDRLSAGSGAARSSDEVMALSDQDFTKFLDKIQK